MPSRFVRCLGCCIASLGQVSSLGPVITALALKRGALSILDHKEFTYEFVAHKKKMGENGPGSLPHSQGRAPLSRGCEAIPLWCSQRGCCTPTSRDRRRAAAALASLKRYTCLISKLSCQQAKTTDHSTHAEKYSDHVDLLSPTPDDTHRLDHAHLPGALT